MGLCRNSCLRSTDGARRNGCDSLMLLPQYGYRLRVDSLINMWEEHDGEERQVGWVKFNQLSMFLCMHSKTNMPSDETSTQ